METIKAKVKTATMTMDINGPLDASIGSIFTMVSDPARRQGILRKLHAIDERMNSPKKPEAEDE